MTTDPEEWNQSLQKFFTPIPEAITEIKERQKNTVLKKAVEDYLGGDLPDYFRGKPVLYLARHIATPNFETLRFIELAKPFGLPIVIGQDSEDIFVSNNSLKKPLGKMPIVRSVSSDGREIIENFTILHFDDAQGKQLKDVKTKFGHELVDFHNQLFRIVYPEPMTVIDDALWITRQHRGDLLEHYKKILALFLAHGVMFEYYPLDEDLFVQHILQPSFDFVYKTFGYKPLICQLVPPEIESTRDWTSYPSILYKIVKNSLESNKFRGDTP